MRRPEHPDGESDRQLEVYEAFARDLIRAHRQDAPEGIARIVAPTDFSVCSMRALRYAERLARRFGAEIVLVHVDPALLLGSEVAETRQGVAQKELEDLVVLLATRGVQARAVVRAGAPAGEILTTAETEHADLIVMGTHGRTGIAHALIGSVAENVVRRSRCPVLTVRDAAQA